MIRRAVAAVALAGLVAVWPVEALAQSATANAAFSAGRYQEAARAWEALYRRGDAAPADLRGLLVALMRVGDYERAIELGREFERGDPQRAVETLNRLGEALYAVGATDEAVQRFDAAIAAGSSDALTARLNRAIADFDAGRRREAMAGFDAFIGVYNRGEARSSEDLVAVGRACTYLGLDDPQLFHDAVRAFERAIAAAPGDPEPRLRLGELFLDKYDGREAAGLIGEALRLGEHWARVQVAEARRLQFEGSADAMARTNRALELNPRLVAARVLKGTMQLSAGDREGARRQADDALKVNAASLPALALRAAVQYLDGDDEGFERTRAAAEERNPGSAVLFETVAEQAAQNRLYASAVQLAERAVAADPGSWEAWGTLGLNQLRVGRIEAGRASLEHAFAGDPFNIWYKNTLDLLDTFADYRSVETEHFELFVRQDRADLVAPYLGAVAEDAWQALTTRYGYRPPGRVRVEVFERHADFSVRTVGLAGLGALGVAFGPVIAVDAPAAAGMGEFNWGATLWHEIAHVIAMGVSEHRVPRWFTEGLSVYEERRAHAGWGDSVEPGFLLALARGELLPVSRINDGFFRPRSPQHLGYSYVQASLVCEFLAERFGFDAIVGMLREYADRASDDEALERVTGWHLERLDAEFDGYLRTRYAGPLAALEPQLARDAAAATGGVAARRDPQQARQRADADPGDFVAQLRAGNGLVEAGQLAEAEPYLRRAKRLFPTYAGSDSPYLGLARIEAAAGDSGAAIEELTTLTQLTGRQLQARLWLSRLLEGAGAIEGAAAVLETAFYIDLDMPEELERAARLHEAGGNWQAVLRARQALLGLDPVDRAAAYYEVARAQLQLGDLAAARRAVLAALEIAPSYAAAQQLLLEVRARRRQT